MRSGVNTLYIGTNASAEPTVGELRFIARLSKSALPTGPTVSEVNGGTAIEGSDVFLLNGQTRSKFYSSVSLSTTGKAKIALRSSPASPAGPIHH